ncbi:glycosyltransferase family 2 protein [Mucilaginibacter sp. KACC 22773]|uniref:glycosyltransferase family 2 protein n=1 Tax=Mucilaginibacter sp. KACC 22773 TaxID=3025671 RepID=UPI00236620D9|nr:glycosyltransferase family 2 protein [Mucilaginibacter sp. KACC 22773]WDF78713.1 glycosyltransferase family 2 protein [Mucilaginibacter sp. KACC 22773]
MLPKINIIIVTYNAAATLQKCLDSIYSQRYPAIDIIIIDGLSTDRTVRLLKDNNAHIAYWKSEKDRGIYDAMNKALDHITGEWVYFLGADDELFPEFSAMAYELKDSSNIYYGSVLSNGKKQSGELSPYYMAKGGIYHQTIIYPRAVFEKYSFNTKYKIVADNVLNMQCYGDGAFKFVYKDYIIAYFNHRGVSGTNVDYVFEKDKSKLILRYFGIKIWTRYLFRLLKAGLKK